MLSGPLVGGHDKVDFVSLLENFPALNLRGVEEQLLALFDLEAQEAKLSCEQNNKGHEKESCHRK